MAFELRITNAGREALADGDNRGTNAIRLTKMAIGDGSGTGGAADDGRTALRNQRAVVALGGSTMVSGRIAVRGEFNPAAAYGVTELGLLGQVGTDPEILVAYWTDGGERLASTVANTRLVIAGSLDIAPAAAEVTVTLDASVSLGDPALSASVTALGGRVDTAETDIDALETRMSTAESDIDAAEADIDALEAAGFGALITALTARVTALEGASVIRSIRRGTVSTTGTNKTATIPSVNVSRSMISLISQALIWGADSPGGSEIRLNLNSATQVGIFVGGTDGQSVTIGYQVVEFE